MKEVIDYTALIGAGALVIGGGAYAESRYGINYWLVAIPLFAVTAPLLDLFFRKRTPSTSSPPRGSAFAQLFGLFGLRSSATMVCGLVITAAVVYGVYSAGYVLTAMFLIIPLGFASVIVPDFIEEWLAKRRHARFMASIGEKLT